MLVKDRTCPSWCTLDHKQYGDRHHWAHVADALVGPLKASIGMAQEPDGNIFAAPTLTLFWNGNSMVLESARTAEGLAVMLTDLKHHAVADIVRQGLAALERVPFETAPGNANAVRGGVR